MFSINSAEYLHIAPVYLFLLSYYSINHPFTSFSLYHPGSSKKDACTALYRVIPQLYNSSIARAPIYSLPHLFYKGLLGIKRRPGFQTDESRSQTDPPRFTFSPSDTPFQANPRLACSFKCRSWLRTGTSAVSLINSSGNMGVHRPGLQAILDGGICFTWNRAFRTRSSLQSQDV